MSRARVWQSCRAWCETQEATIPLVAIDIFGYQSAHTLTHVIRYGLKRMKTQLADVINVIQIPTTPPYLRLVVRALLIIRAILIVDGPKREGISSCLPIPCFVRSIPESGIDDSICRFLDRIENRIESIGAQNLRIRFSNRIGRFRIEPNRTGLRVHAGW